MLQRSRRIFLILLILLLLGACASAPYTPHEVSDVPEVPEAPETPAVLAPPEWPALLTTSAARELMDSGTPFVLLDVRTEEEFADVHIPDAVLLPLDVLREQASTYLPDKEIAIIIYCHSGRRSAEAAMILIDLGYHAVFDLGGIINWPYETIVSD